MKRGWMFVAAAAGLAGCGQGSDNASNSGNAAANAAAPAKKHPAYCFFSDAANKGWTASRDATGNVVVKGKGELDDRRYMAVLGDPEVSGTNATLWLTMGVNTTGMGARDNWWDVSATVPDSAAVDSVKVMCGKKVVADLPLKK